MPKHVLRIRHPSAQADAYLGKEGEITVDLTNKELRVHDESTVGGFPAARADMANVQDATNSQDGRMPATRIVELESATTKLTTIESGATADQTNAEIKTAYELNADTNAFTDAQLGKLNGIEAAATADQTGAEIKVAYELEADTNAYNDAAVIKLAGIEVNATADQTNAEIKTAYELNANTNAFTDAEQTKLTNIETGATADQSNAEIKTAYEANANTNAFTDADVVALAAANQTATTVPSTATGDVAATNVQAAIAELASEKSNITATETLTNKTLSTPILNSPVLNGTLSGDAFLNEPLLTSNSAVKGASQQSIKTYVDTRGILQIKEVNTVTFAAHTTIIPFDNTIPLITEGTQILSLPFTPKKATSKLKLAVSIPCSGSITNGRLLAVIFDATSGGLITAFPMFSAISGAMGTIAGEVLINTASTSARTYTVRVGANAGSFYLLGTGAGGFYGGTALKASLIIEEIHDT